MEDGVKSHWSMSLSEITLNLRVLQRNSLVFPMAWGEAVFVPSAPCEECRVTGVSSGGVPRKELPKTNCGEAGIRTLDTASGIPVFETGAFNHSATSPRVE